LNIVTKTFQFGDRQVTLETGRIAKQATGSVLVTMGNTVVLSTVVGMKSMKPGQSFFPLTVNYQEKAYAAGKIPGGFFRREGRPSEKETLTSRLIDRPLRPLFPKGFMNEVQVVCTVMSADRDEDPDIASLIGASAALAVSGIPFDGPVAAARVGYRDGQYMLNPGYAALKDSQLLMVVAGTRDAVLMVESEAEELTEDEMLGAVLLGIRKCSPLSVPSRRWPKKRASRVGTGSLLPVTMHSKTRSQRRSVLTWARPIASAIRCSGRVAWANCVGRRSSSWLVAMRPSSAPMKWRKASLRLRSRSYVSVC